MMRRLSKGAALAAVVVLGWSASALHASAEAQRPSPFATFYAVAMSPRCKNCHAAGDAPLQGDLSRPHIMNVSRTSTSSGLACTTCHGAKNAEFPHGPPGVPNWRMPNADTPLVFEGKTLPELCEQVKDPARNGGKSLAEVEEHMRVDPMVLWTWQPGPGRTVPPHTFAETMKAVHEWVESGGRCP
jgi:hypothetical protein